MQIQARFRGGEYVLLLGIVFSLRLLSDIESIFPYHFYIMFNSTSDVNCMFSILRSES